MMSQRWREIEVIADLSWYLCTGLPENGKCTYVVTRDCLLHECIVCHPEIFIQTVNEIMRCDKILHDILLPQNLRNQKTVQRILLLISSTPEKSSYNPYMTHHPIQTAGYWWRPVDTSPLIFYYSHRHRTRAHMLLIQPNTPYRRCPVSIYWWRIDISPDAIVHCWHVTTHFLLLSPTPDKSSDEFYTIKYPIQTLSGSDLLVTSRQIWPAIVHCWQRFFSTTLIDTGQELGQSLYNQRVHTDTVQ
jgi:hypothetical protein